MVDLIDMNVLLQGFSWEVALELVLPMLTFLVGVVLYSIFIFKMYKLIASRDIFGENKKYRGFSERINAEEGGIGSKIAHFFEYIIFFPIVVFIFFIFFFLLLIFLSKEPNVQGIMLIAMAIVGAIRVTAYYSEDLSKDLAKMMPFALLGLYIVDISYFSFESSMAAIQTAISNNTLITLLAYYLIFIIILEFILRIFYFIYSNVTSYRAYVDEMSD